MQDIFGAAKVLSVVNKAQFKRDLRDFYLGLRDSVRMDDEEVFLRISNTDYKAKQKLLNQKLNNKLDLLVKQHPELENNPEFLELRKSVFSNQAITI